MLIVGTDKLKIIGLEKNGCTAIKQLTLKYDFIKGYQKKPDHYCTELYDQKIFLDNNTTFLMPLRDEMKRLQSGFIQDFNDLLIDLGIKEKRYVKEFINRFCVSFPHWQNRKGRDSNLIYDTSYRFYLESEPIKYFMDNIFSNENWKGCKFYFFNLSSISTDNFSKVCGKFDKRFETHNIKVDFSNTIKESKLKNIIVECFDELKNERLLDYKDIYNYTSNIQDYFINKKPVLDSIRNSEYFLNI